MVSYFDIFQIFYINNIVYLSINLLLFLAFIFIMNLYNKKLFSKYLLFFNIIINHFKKILDENLNKTGKYYVIPVLTLFFFLLIFNLIGLIVYSFPLTTHISLTFGLAISCWLGIIFLGIFNYRYNFFSNYMPNGAPLLMSSFLVLIEIISAFSRPIALGLRLAANLTAGHILLGIISNFSLILLLQLSSVLSIIPFIVILLMVTLEIGVAIIQSYVFCLLLIIYLKESKELH